MESLHMTDTKRNPFCSKHTSFSSLAILLASPNSYISADIRQNILVVLVKSRGSHTLSLTSLRGAKKKDNLVRWCIIIIPSTHPASKLPCLFTMLSTTFLYVHPKTMNKMVKPASTNRLALSTPVSKEYLHLHVFLRFLSQYQPPL